MPEMQKDLVLSINEYAYVLDRTKGNVSCWVGPAKTSLSTSDEMVVFNENTKAFEPARNYYEATKLFTTAPENWYVILKNPTENNSHPRPGTANNLPDNIQIGRKVNIRGPVSFPLYPGQMAKVIRGHALRTNQYLLARVYEAAAASQSQGEMLDAEGNKIEKTEKYVNGQILVIKGTEVSFYIPPTGIEVIPRDGDSRKGYVREAVTLERLEYCILKDEDGNKRYVHGPEVVFPEPTETFVTSPKGGYVFRAMELSPISGLYVKVIAEYKDEDGTNHPVGEEMFITGNDQMIYYPRPEHAIINYDGKLMHHAIAIPEGEGRYVMNRLTGEINTVRGPAMYLPDPRTEVVVKRKLTEKQCNLWFPGNHDALAYNLALNEKAVEKSVAKGTSNYANVDFCFSTADTATTLANLEAKANISRGTSYSKPRTITLDTKYEGVVAIDIWTGYAVNVISKDGTRKVEESLMPMVLELFAKIKRIFNSMQKLQIKRLENLFTSDTPDMALEKKYTKLRLELFENVSQIRLHDDRVAEILEQLTKRDQLLLGLEGKLLRLAMANKIKREDFLAEYAGNELNRNWVKKLAKHKNAAWANFAKKHGDDILKIQEDIIAIAVETGQPTS